MRIRGREVRRPALGPAAKVAAVVAAAPIPLLVLGVVGYQLWLAAHGRPSEVLPALGGLLFWLAFLALPILGALWLGSARLRSVDAALRRHPRSQPRLPRSVHVVRYMTELPAEPRGVPLFERPFAHLWSTVAVVDVGGVELEVFELIHGDLRGEPGKAPRFVLGLPVVTCAAFRIDGDVPPVVVRPSGSKRFSLPDGAKRRHTELERFNESHRVLSADPYAASVLVDPRTIEAIEAFDPRFAVELGGSWVVVHAPRLTPRDIGRLVLAAAGLARTFPTVAGSVYPPPVGLPSVP